MSITDLIPWKREDNNLKKQQKESSISVLRNDFDQLFQEFFDQPFSFLNKPLATFQSSEQFHPSVNLSETKKQIKITAELPGIDPEDIDLELSDDSISIQGKKESKEEEKGEHYYHMERSYGTFYRTIPLPAEINADKVEANYKKGVLTITLPKKKIAQAKNRIKIN